METKTCPGCGMKMIKRSTGVATLSIPALHGREWWCGNCEHTEHAEPWREPTEDEINRALWKQAQDELKDE